MPRGMIEFDQDGQDIHDPLPKIDRDYVTGRFVEEGTAMEDKKTHQHPVRQRVARRKDSLIYVGALTEKAIEEGIIALEPDTELARKVMANDV